MRATILIVEDSFLADELLALLDLEGYNTIRAHYPSEALHVIREIAPDVIVTNIHLPDVGGLELIRRLPAFSGAPIIAMSDAPHYEYLAYRAGAVDFLIKPFQTEAFLTSIHRALRFTDAEDKYQ